MSITQFPRPAPYLCTWTNFRVGLLDRWAERSVSPNSDIAPRPSSRVLLAGSLVAFAMVAGMALLVGQAGSGIAGAMSLVGTRFIANLSITLAAAAWVFTLVGIPLWVGWKVSLFTKSMCLRGWELRNGLRRPASFS